MAGIAQSVVSVRNFSMPPRCLGVIGRLVSVNRDVLLSLPGGKYVDEFLGGQT